MGRGEDRAGDRFAPGHQAAADAEPRLELAARPAQHLLVLDLLLGKAQERPQPRHVALHIAAGVIDDHGHPLGCALTSPLTATMPCNAAMTPTRDHSCRHLENPWVWL